MHVKWHVIVTECSFAYFYSSYCSFDVAYDVYLVDMCFGQAKLEEADLRLAEIKKEEYEFERDIVKGASNPRTGKANAEKVSKYLEDKLRAKVKQITGSSYFGDLFTLRMCITDIHVYDRHYYVCTIKNYRDFMLLSAGLKNLQQHERNEMLHAHCKINNQ